MGRFCLCGLEVTLGHILIGCDAYNLQPLLTLLQTVLSAIHSDSNFKTLSPGSWGASPWYPLLALRELEEAAYPIVKGRRKILRSLKKSRQRREWIIGNYYWAIWKWRMKEIHDTSFNFVPANCTPSLRDILNAPIPAHLLAQVADDGPDAKPSHDKHGPVDATLLGDLTKLPPPVSHITRGGTGKQLTNKGRSILRAIEAPGMDGGPQYLSGQGRILRALTDNAYA